MYLIDLVSELDRCWDGARRGKKDDVKEARISVRRIRSVLETYQSILRPQEASVGLLRDLTRSLGSVKDLDEMAQRLPDEIGKRPPDNNVNKASRVLQERLRKERKSALRRLERDLSSKRHKTLSSSLKATIAARSRSVTRENAASAVISCLAKAWQEVHGRVEGRVVMKADELHEIRKRVRALRTSIEAAGALLESEAWREFASEAETLQDLLGDHHDAVDTRRWLEKAAKQSRTPAADLAQELAQVQRQKSERLEKEWPPHWELLESRWPDTRL